MEAFCERFGATGSVLILTNDSAHWSPQRHADTFDAAFRLDDLHFLGGTLAWNPATGKGTTKKREARLVVTGNYSLAWRDFADVGGAGAGCAICTSRSTVRMRRRINPLDAQ